MDPQQLNPNSSPPSPAAQPPLLTPPPLHQSDADEEDESVKQLKECSVLYLSLQDCLANTVRNWKSCQKEVLALKTCHERKKKNDK